MFWRTALVSTLISCLLAIGVILASIISGRRSALRSHEPEGPRFELLLQ